MGIELIAPQVQTYLDELVPTRPAEVQKMEAYGEESGFPIVGPASAHICYLFGRMIQANSVFEMGSGYGYSTAFLAQAVRENGGGVVHHVVWDEALSTQARQHLGALGFEDIIQYHIGEAVAALRETPGPFDLIFMDIEKPGYPVAIPLVKEKLRSGGVLVIDNMLLSGRIFDEKDTSENTRAVRQTTALIANDPDWITTIIPVRDGLQVAYKRQLE